MRAKHEALLQQRTRGALLRMRLQSTAFVCIALRNCNHLQIIEQQYCQCFQARILHKA